MIQNIEEVKQQIKDNISVLLDKNKIGKAKNILQQYCDMVPNDIDTYSIEAVIAMMEQKFDVAESILREGLSVDNNNYDLSYNLGYLYEIERNIVLAQIFYKRAKKCASTSQLRTEAHQALERLQQQDIGKHDSSESNRRQTSIVILTYNNLEYNKLCLESIRKYTEKGTYEIIVVDNNSTDGTVDWLKEQEDLKVVFNKENLGFPKGCNQGIEVAKDGNDILLLNNDTVVTPNWLRNLQISLCSTTDIGAVGAVTNSCSNYQMIPVQYKTIDEMLQFAQEYNKSDESKWEERLRLVGYCMLIRNEAIKEIGMLDEIFTPGNFEDDDYSLRIRQAGYKLLLCKDTFIHHFGSMSFGKEKNKYNGLLNTNRKKFQEKWEFDPYYIIDIRKDITKLIKEDNSKAPKILQIGCAGGGTLLDIKNDIPDANLYGIELNRNVVVNNEHFASIKIGGLDCLQEYEPDFFDCIILTIPQTSSDILINNLKAIKKYLKGSSTIITILPKQLNINNKSLNKKLKKIFNNFNIKFYKNREEVLLNLKIKKDLDEYLIKKFHTHSEETSNLFDFDEIKALQIVNLNKNQFLKLINNAKMNLKSNNYEQASRWCYKAAKYASENHPGFYTSQEIENILIKCANNLPSVNNDIELSKYDNGKRKVLHVLSEGYAIGGHTKLAKNWIERDKTSKHSLITTWQIDSSPDSLISVVKESGGWTYSLQHITDFIGRAATLRKIAYEWADIVVLHTHMFDPIPIMAFGVKGGPPVLYMNHGDHVFWLGTFIIDNLINFRQSGEELSINRRGISRNSILPLSLALPKINANDKKRIRKNIGIKEDMTILLTIATPYKFNSFGKVHYTDILKRILKKNDNTMAIVIGPSNTGIWEKAYKETNGRILPLGIKENIKNYYIIADIYIDSYMIGSVTSALDGGLYGLPIAALENYNNKTLSFNDIAYDDSNKKFNNIEDYISYISKLVRDKDYRKKEGKVLSNKIKKDHIDTWKGYLNSIYEKVEDKTHDTYLNNEFENKLGNEDLFLALFQSNVINNKKIIQKDSSNTEEKTLSEPIKKKDDLIKLKENLLKYYNENMLYLAQLFAEQLLRHNLTDYNLLHLLALIHHKKNETWLVNKYLTEAIKYCPKNSKVIINYIEVNLLEDIKKFIDENYIYNKDNKEYLTYYYRFKSQEYFNALFENRQYIEALNLYNRYNSIKANLYKVTTVRDFCVYNNYKYFTVEEEQNREVFIPYYYGSKEKEQIKKIKSPEVYIAELENVNIVGENSIIIADDYCLHDMAKRDYENRYDLRFSSLINIDKNNAIVESINTNEVFEEAIFLIGFASYNYYHFTIELISRLQYIDNFEEYRTIPLLIDEIALKNPQYSELLKVINKFNHPVVAVKRNYMYKVKKLIYPSYNTWMPINIKEGEKLKHEDYLISNSAVEYIRSNVLENIKSKGFRKIFISRKNSSNARLINEEDVIEFFKQYGFEIIYPEDLTFQQQVKLFSEAEYVVGATGAAFTNILYCPKNAKVMCIIPKEYDFCIYSTITKILDLQCVFLDAEVVDRKKNFSTEQFKLDLNYCNDCLKELQINKSNDNQNYIIEHLHKKIDYIINSYNQNISNNNIFYTVGTILQHVVTINSDEKDINKYFEIQSYLKYILNVIDESMLLNDINQINIIFHILFKELKETKEEKILKIFNNNMKYFNNSTEVEEVICKKTSSKKI